MDEQTKQAVINKLTIAECLDKICAMCDCLRSIYDNQTREDMLNYTEQIEHYVNAITVLREHVVTIKGSSKTCYGR